MTVEEIMTQRPACCTANSGIREAAQMMVECDCGEIPVVDREGKPIGVVTDRDITCRVVAGGLDLENCTVGECMSSPVLTLKLETTLEECCQLMEEAQVRRIPVVDSNGRCCGIVSQADIARKSDGIVDEIVKEVSTPNPHASNAAACC